MNPVIGCNFLYLERWSFSEDNFSCHAGLVRLAGKHEDEVKKMF